MRRALSIVILIFLPGLAFAQSGKPAYQRGYLHPQFVQDGRGNVGMLWVKLGGSGGHDIFLAKRQANGALQDPAKVNSSDGDVLYLPMDQARPGIAAGPGGRVGVSWFDKNGRLFVGLSKDGGNSFDRSVEVAPGHGRPEHAFSDVALDASGTLFVTWIDCRDAPAGHEEPAQLYAARLDRDQRPVVVNLTGEFTESICGCCRPDIYIKGRDVFIGFRMTEPDGHRDIYQVRLGADLEPREPERMGTPLWKIDACPMAGPVTVGEFTWFLDGSTGKMLLMEGFSSNAPAVPVGAAKVVNPRSPRLVEGGDGQPWMLYLPGAERGQVLLRDPAGWQVAVDDVPYFCTDVTFVEGQFLMVGDKEGTLWMEARPQN
jgi:hypothetical protein